MTEKQRDHPGDALLVPMGDAVVKVLDLAYRARRPLLLEGTTGIGKSQIVSEFARSRGLDLIILDLSLLEPPDLIGLPVVRDGLTHYAAPAELPRSGRGILMLEELNRAEIPVMQPALQLLSARQLHSYSLPEGWNCVAAINPENSDYQVHRLDPALRSRFLQLSVYPERESWLPWARRGLVHPLVIKLVESHPDAFDDASPRSWTYASDLLNTLRPEEMRDKELVRIALRGYLPAPWAIVAANALAIWPDFPGFDWPSFLQPDGPQKLRSVVDQLDGGNRPDAIATLASKIQRELRRGSGLESSSLAFLEQLLSPLPGDFREQCLEAAVQSPAARVLFRETWKMSPEDFTRGYREDSPLREAVLEDRGKFQFSRLSLAVSAVLQWLEEEKAKGRITPTLQDSNPPPLQLSGELKAALHRFAGDVSPLAEKLLAWLQARDSKEP